MVAFPKDDGFLTVGKDNLQESLGEGGKIIR